MAPAGRYFASSTAASTSKLDVSSSAAGAGHESGSNDGADEDDFMSDKFLKAATAEDSKRAKTYSEQRRDAAKRSEERGRIKSRAEREREAREEGLRRNLFEPSGHARDGVNDQDAVESAAPAPASSNKALAMMMKMGFKPGEALGKKASPAPLDSRSQSENDDAEEEDDGFISLSAGIGSKKRTAASAALNGSGSGAKGKAKADDRRIDPIEIQMRKGRSGLGVEESKRRRLHDLADSTQSKEKMSVDDYRLRAKGDHDDRRALGKLVSARKTLKELDERIGITDNNLLLDPHEEYARQRAELLGGDRFGPRSRLGDFGAVDEADEENYGFGDDQNRDSKLKEGQIPVDLEGEEAFEDEEIIQREEEKERFLRMDARSRLDKTLAYLRNKHKYCLWCGAQYSSKEELESECPGFDEDDH